MLVVEGISRCRCSGSRPSLSSSRKGVRMNHPQTIARVFGVLYLITFFTSIPALFVFFAHVLADARLILGYVTARVMESVFTAVGILSLLTIVTLRQEATAGADAASLLTAGESLVALHDWTFLLGPGFFVGVGNGLILGYLMYTSRFVPRGMAVLGLIGGPLIIVTGIGVMFGVIEAGGVVQGIATIPEGLWELGLGI